MAGLVVVTPNAGVDRDRCGGRLTLFLDRSVAGGGDRPRHRGLSGEHTNPPAAGTQENPRSVKTEGVLRAIYALGAQSRDLVRGEHALFSECLEELALS